MNARRQASVWLAFVLAPDVPARVWANDRVHVPLSTTWLVVLLQTKISPLSLSLSLSIAIPLSSPLCLSLTLSPRPPLAHLSDPCAKTPTDFVSTLRPCAHNTSAEFGPYPDRQRSGPASERNFNLQKMARARLVRGPTSDNPDDYLSILVHYPVLAGLLACVSVVIFCIFIPVARRQGGSADGSRPATITLAD